MHKRRCLPLLDDMSHWTADRPGPPKYILSISEARYQSPGDDIYASAPVSYVALEVRFAVWDSAGNCALVQPVKLQP